MPSVLSLWRDLSPRARVGVSVAAAAVLLGGPVALVGPVVRAKVATRAAARGVRVDVERVRLGRQGIWLLGVGVASRQGRVAGELDAVLVPFGDATVEVHGGRLALRGTLAELEAELAGGARSEGGGARRRVMVDGLSARWTELEQRGLAVTGFGIAVRREASEDKIRADLAQIMGPGASAELRGAALSFGPSGPGRVRSAEVAAVEATLDLDAVKQVRALGGAKAGAPPSASAAPAASVGAGPVPAVARALGVGTLAGAARGALAEGAELKVRSLLFALRFDGEHLGFGPSELHVRREAEALALELLPGERQGAGATPLALRGRWPFGAGTTSVELEGGPVSLAALGVRDGELGLTRTREATLEAHLHIELGADVVKGSGKGSLVNVSLSRQELSAREVRGLRLGFRADGEAARDGSRVNLRELELSIGDVKLAGKLDFERDRTGSRVRWAGGVPLASCDAVIGSIPAALLSDARGVRLEGTFALDHALAYDSAKPSALALTLHVENGCRVVEAPDELSPERFRAPWTREVKGADGLPFTIRSGPGTPEWLSYDEIPKTMEIAVLVCEDGGFFRHRGFDFRAIEKAMKDDIQAGRFLRGASTISMQLAKNLYLGKEKTLSRKIEEALFTMLLESKLTKQELMALYLNVVELGPGIYGIQQAAKYYFDETAKELSLGQALYLASILPDPTRQHFEPDGRVSPRWAEYIKKLMRIARSVDRITDEELEAGLGEELAFRKGNGEARLRELGGTEPASTNQEGMPFDDDAARP